MQTGQSPGLRSLRFLGRVQFTMILLLGGAVVMTAATIIESRGGRDVAQAAVYATSWFSAFLFLIAVNLIMAIVNRWPLAWHQWSFVLTHLSIVLLLIGAGISATFGFEGRLIVPEGSEESRIYLDSSEVRVLWRGGEAALPLPAAPSASTGVIQPEGLGRPEVRVVGYVPRGVASLGLGEGGPEGGIGVELEIVGSQLHAHPWLIAGSGRHGRRDLGPVEVELRVDSDPGRLEARPSASRDSDGALVIPLASGGEAARISLPAGIGQEVEVAPGVVAVVRSFFLRARMVDGELRDVANAPINPAAILEVRDSGGREEHYVFANYPDFGAVHGRRDGEPLILEPRLVGSFDAAASKPQISIIVDPRGGFHLQLSTADGRSQAEPLEPGRAVPVGDLGLHLTLERVVEGARPQIVVAAAARGDESAREFIRLQARLGGARVEAWLGAGSSQRLALGAESVELLFTRQTRGLPFSIALRDFELVRHPGSSRPAEYRSHVRVREVEAGLPPRDTVISMNRPLDVAGFRLFQSSYQLGTGGVPDTTILSVSHDPGVPVVYTAFALIVIGIAGYLRRNGTRSRVAARPMHRAPERRTPLKRTPARAAASERRTEA